MIPKKNKLKKEDFPLLRGGKTFSSPHLMVRVKEVVNQTKGTFSFVVSKKVSKKSTVRNRLKRFGYRAIKETLAATKTKGLHAFFFKGVDAERLSYEEVRREVSNLLEKTGLS